MASGWSPQPPPEPHRGRLDDVRTVGTLLIIHGALMLVWFAFCVMGASVGVLTRLSHSQEEWESTLMVVGYGVFAIGALSAGTLQLVSGIRLLSWKNRVLALVAMWAGLAAFFLGAVFCFPTALGVVIYGHMVLLDREVAERFRQLATGASPR